MDATGSVEQILAFAGGQFGNKQYELEVVMTGHLVTQAIAAAAPAALAAAIEVESHIPSDLPPVMGDSAEYSARGRPQRHQRREHQRKPDGRR